MPNCIYVTNQRIPNEGTREVVVFEYLSCNGPVLRIRIEHPFDKTVAPVSTFFYQLILNIL